MLLHQLIVNARIASVAGNRHKALCAKEKTGHLSGLLHQADEVKGFIRHF
jgi:hypothetical protein